MANQGSVHNDLFIASFENVQDAAAELRSSLPQALVDQLRWESLKSVSGSFVDKSLRWSQSDQLYEIQCRDQPALVYVLWEHKSEVDKWTLLQLLRYMVRIWEKCLAQKPAPPTLPPIIPVIIHHSNSGWTATTSFQGLFDEALMANAALQRMTPAFEATIDDISHAQDAELRIRGLSPKALLGLVFLRDGRAERRLLEELEYWADQFRALLGSPDGVRAIQQLFSYLFQVASELEWSDLEAKIRQVIPETEELLMTLEEKLIQKGIAQGISQGIAQGISQGIAQGISQGISQGELQGKRNLLQRQLVSKFGSIAGDALARLESADSARLELYAERVIAATSIAEVMSD